MNDSPQVKLEVASAKDAPVVSNLLQLYAYDLSDVFNLDLTPEGKFSYDKLPLYWSEPKSRFPLLMRYRDKLAGFALVTRGSPASDDPEVFDVAEFFVLRRYRRAGVGGQAAFLLWDRFPVQWTVRVSEGNVGGCGFWSRAVAQYTNGAFKQSASPGKPHAWRIFSFDSRLFDIGRK